MNDKYEGGSVRAVASNPVAVREAMMVHYLARIALALERAFPVDPAELDDDMLRHVHETTVSRLKEN